MSEVRYETCPPEGIIEHEYSKVFPTLDERARRELEEDIRKNGVLEPIVFIGPNVILDGRHRYYAARHLGIAYPRVQYEGDDPLAFVIGKNLARRHLTDSQRAIAAAKIAKLPRGRPPIGGINPPSVSDAAQALNVPERTVERAKEVVSKGTPELVEAVETGSVSVSAASDLAALPPAEQVETVKAGPEAAKAKAKAVRQSRPKRAPAPAPEAEAERTDDPIRASNWLRDRIGEAVRTERDRCAAVAEARCEQLGQPAIGRAVSEAILADTIGEAA